MALGPIAVVVGILAVIGGVFFFSDDSTEDQYVPLLAFTSSNISPEPDFFGVTTIKVDEKAIITLNVDSLSNDYNHDGKLVLSFEHEDAYQYFKIDKNEINVGIIQQAGATSGPKSFTITAIKDPGQYQDNAIVELFIDDDLNAKTSFKLKIE